MKPTALLTAATLATSLLLPTSTHAAAPARGTAITLSNITPDGKPHSFQTKNKQFTLDGQPTLLIAGEMHFGRILPEDFETRVKQAKAMGLNTLSYYLFWNQVEPEEGKFDFTGMNDIRRMFKICQDNGMWVILRPGPYCCAEVEYGGIPYWTLKGDNANAKIRTSDPKYAQWSKNYITRVAKEVADLQVSKGGPLLMIQLENEYAMVAPVSGGSDYVKSLAPMYRDAGIDIPLYACDPGSFVKGTNPYGTDILWGRNGMSGATGADATYQQYASVAGDFPLYSPEVYTAWFSGWGQPIATRHAGIPEITTATNFFLDHNMSWCYYVFFGGTNWGYNTGCNEYLPVQTSYDYSAPIDEAGRTTPKYQALRTLLAARTGRTLPEPPPEPSVTSLPTIKFTEHQTLLENAATLTAAKIAQKPTSMEDLNQDYGFVLYRHTFPTGIKGTLELHDARDYAITMINGKTVGKSFIGYGPDANKITLNESGPTTLDILVHNLGRISVITSANSQSRARKGLIGGATLDGTEIPDWQTLSLPLASVTTLQPTPTPHTGPTFYHSTFTLDKPTSTFLNLSNFSMGVVWVNGHNLGRFWDRGGARSLFLSQHFLHPGTNDITVLELHDAPKTPEIESTTKMVESTPVPFAMTLDKPIPTPAPPARGR